jgi:hypothetical protein
MTRRSRLPVLWASGAAFLGLFAALAVQLRLGHDPALGAGRAAPPASPRPVLIRRVIERRVIVRVIPAASSDPAQPTAGGSASARRAVVSAPVVTGSASPPAPAPAPAPAPTPAPVTRAS